MFLVLAAVIVLLAACSGFEISEEEQRFVGTWVSIPTEGTIMTMTLRDDKTAEIKINGYKSPDTIQEEIKSVSGYWSVFDGKLTVNYGLQLTTITIPFTVDGESIQTNWGGNYKLYKEA